MKKIILILLAFLLTSNVNAQHWEKNGTKNFDLRANCSKTKSILRAMPDVIPGGELIKLNSFTAFDQRFAMNGAYKNNPVEITGYLILPKGSDKGVTIGGKHAEEYMPQALNFFKENLL